MSTSSLQPGQQVGDFLLDRLLGRGGMGEVWLATDTNADRPVALKFIKRHLLDEDPNFRMRFLNEAKTLGRLEHDRIVRLYSVLNTPESLALVLAFIDGRSLASEIDERGALPLPYVLAIARDVLPALGFAHERGIIHRDIKAENIMIDRQGRAFLSDFGIAVTEFSQRGTMAGSAIGTPSYMSPEQIRDSRAISAQTGGHRSDIYSFGILLFEMLTGRLPFPGADMSVIHAHLLATPPTLREINPAVPPAIESIVLRCLAKEADARPQTCGELLQLLMDAAAGAPPPPMPPPVPGRSATIVEGAIPPVAAGSGTVAIGPGGALPGAPRPAAPVAASGSPGVPKAAWLALGGLVMVGGVGYALWTSTGTAKRNEPAPAYNPGPAPMSEQVSARQPVQPPPTGTPAANPTSQPANARVDAASSASADAAFAEAKELAAQGSNCEAKAPIANALRIDPNEPRYLQLQREVVTKCVSEQNAERLAVEARSLGQSGKPCDGKKRIDEAIRLNPAKANTFASLRDDLDQACGSTAESDKLAAKAEAQWSQGEYCAAETTMQQAIQKSPAAAKKYQFRLTAMAAGCKASLQ